MIAVTGLGVEAQTLEKDQEFETSLSYVMRLCFFGGVGKRERKGGCENFPPRLQQPSSFTILRSLQNGVKLAGRRAGSPTQAPGRQSGRDPGLSPPREA